MPIKDKPHYTIDTAQLANWLRNSGEESWWTVDGDPILTERLNFPCPGPEISEVLQTLDGGLLFLDPQKAETANGQGIDSDELGKHVTTDEEGDRVLQFAWENIPDANWLLIEDKESPKLSQSLEEVA